MANKSWKAEFRVVVVGGGIGGLTAAIAIKSADFEVEVLEAAQSLQEIGAGIEIPPNASRILYSYGLKSSLEPLVLKGDAIYFRSWRSGRVISTTPLGQQLEEKYGAPHVHIHRADLVHALAKRALDVGVRIKLNAAVNSIDFGIKAGTPDELTSHHIGQFAQHEATIHLEHGSPMNANLVIGADGQRSKCRSIITGSPTVLKRSGDITYRITLPTDVLRRSSTLREFVEPPNVNAWLGPHGHIVAYPVKRGDLFNLFLGGPDEKLLDDSAITAPAMTPVHDAIERFRDWDPRVVELLEAAPQLLKWTLVVQDDLENWTHPSGGLVLLGDAAHAMLPYMGQGAAQAIEDAATIAKLLDSCEVATDLPALLRAYEELRSSRAMYIKGRAWGMRKVVGLPDGPEQEERDRRMAQEPFEGCPNPTVDPVLQKWLWGHDAIAVAAEHSI